MITMGLEILIAFVCMMVGYWKNLPFLTFCAKIFAVAALLTGLLIALVGLNVLSI